MQARDWRTILVVDDDQYALKALGEALTMEGYAIVEAGDGQEALDYLQCNALPDLILLDLVMPRMDAWQFLARRAQDDRFATIPVVVVSGSETEIPSRIDAVPKPYEFATLLNLIRHYVLAEGASADRARRRMGD
jgi:CheY-like chemotaxis protein